MAITPLINSPANLFPGLRMVLVETTDPGNIGAAARAMKNMGVTELYLVNPRRFPDEKALFRAAGAADVVREAKVVSTLDEAVRDCQLLLGTSARPRRIPWPLLDPQECGRKVAEEVGKGAKAAILFGRESRGLTNEELRRCQFHVKIPTGKAYQSLNLAMAVQLLAYEVLKAKLVGTRRKEPDDDWDMPVADAAAVEYLLAHLEETLIQVGFHDPENPRQLMTRLRRMFARIRLDRMEVDILRGFLDAVNKSVAGGRPGVTDFPAERQ